MKAFFSDFHMRDRNERDDFHYHKEFDELVTKLSEEFKNIEIILLGDTFDLIRTQKYYGPQAEPFTEDKIKEVKIRVMAEILEDHAAFFQTLRSFVQKPEHTFRYILGNHDFGASLDPRLLEMIQQKFGLAFVPENYYRDTKLNIWAEHGHRYDVINNTYNKDGTPIPYCLGDQIVVEIVDEFIEKVREKQIEFGIDPAILSEINDLDNVRPQSAIANWLGYIDETGQLKQLYYDTITGFIVKNAGEVGTLAWEFLTGKYQPDLIQAARDLAQKGLGKYIIFGHTHDALEKEFTEGAKHLNSGTWRKFVEPKGPPSTRMRTLPTYKEGEVQLYTQEPYFYYEFNSTINLSYVLFYEDGEGEVGPQLVQQVKDTPEA